MRTSKTLVATIRFACPIEEANVTEVLARLAGKTGYSELVSTDIVRGDVAAYRAERAKINAERKAAREAKAEKKAKKPSGASAPAPAASRPALKRAGRRAPVETPRAAAG
jgi:hypothetical protein